MPASSPPPPRWWHSRIRSFGFALQGVRDLFATQVHAKFHAAATASVVIAAVGFGVSRLEALALALAIGMVWAAEAFNTALEALVDLVHPAWDSRAGRVKDLAAGAVLLACLGASVVGVLVFVPKIWPAIVK